jgi:hypothetical protein
MAWYAATRRSSGDDHFGHRPGRVVEQNRAHLVRLGHQPEQVGQRLLVDAQARRRRQPQLLDALRPARGELGGDPAAEADAAENDFIESEGVEKFDVVERHVLDGIDLVEAAGLVEAGVRRHQDLEVARPGVVERQPAGRLAEGTVQVDERRAVAAAEDHGRPAGDVDHLGRAALARQQHAGGVA